MIEHIIRKAPSPSTSILEIPSMNELVKMPFFGQVNIDYAYKNGSDFHRYLINNSPLKNTKSNIVVTSFVQYLTPEIKPSIQRFERKFPDGEWHCDTTGSPLVENDINHLFVTDCDARTEFFKEDITVNVEKDIKSMDFRYFVNVNAENLGIKSSKAEPNCFTTFTNHLHRSISPCNNELRFFMRITESDGINKTDDSVVNTSYVYKGTQRIVSIEKNKGRTNIYD